MRIAKNSLIMKNGGKYMKKLSQIIILVVVLGIGIGGYFMLKGNNNENNKSEKTPNSTDSQNSQQANAENKVRKSDPCKLFEPVEFTRVWGLSEVRQTKIIKEIKNSDHVVNGCEFEQSNDGSVAGLSAAYNFVVKIQRFENDQAAKTRFESDLSSIKQFSTRQSEIDSPIKVGDGTYFNVAASGEIIVKTESYIVVLKGNEIIDISSVRIDGVDQTTNRGNLITMAQKKL